MSTTQALIAMLKSELKAAHLTYADLARELGMAESSIKPSARTWRTTTTAAASTARARC
jgi:transcriptional regulator with XRE-family HTH domain